MSRGKKRRAPSQVPRFQGWRTQQGIQAYNFARSPGFKSAQNFGFPAGAARAEIGTQLHNSKISQFQHSKVPGAQGIHTHRMSKVTRFFSRVPGLFQDVQK